MRNCKSLKSILIKFSVRSNLFCERIREVVATSTKKHIAYQNIFALFVWICFYEKRRKNVSLTIFGDFFLLSKFLWRLSKQFAIEIEASRSWWKVKSLGKCVRNFQSMKTTVVGRFHCVAARLLSNASNVTNITMKVSISKRESVKWFQLDLK